MTHNTGPVGIINSDIKTKVDDYLLVPQDDPSRPAVYASGDLYTYLATSKETNFDFNFFDFFLPVGGGPPPHFHPYEHETWYITAGNIQYNLGNQGTNSIVLPEGSLIFGARNRIHGYRNLDSTASITGKTPGARTLSLTTPGALDLFFENIATPIIDRNDPIPGFSAVPGDDTYRTLAEFSIRTNAGINFAPPDYQPPSSSNKYVLVLPEDAEGEVVEQAKELSKIDGFSVWTTGEQEGLAQRPTFDGPFGIEYTSLLSLEESGNELSYNQFSLSSQETDTFVQANLNASQVVKHSESLATGVADLEPTLAGDGIIYELTVNGLDFGELLPGGTPQTPDNELDDVTAIHIHSGDRGSSGPHTFSILDPHHQDEENLSIKLNADGSTTISGIWNSTEAEIPTDLSDFLTGSGLPGEESDYYFQIHTEGNPSGEIRGQIALNSDDFPDPVKSEDHQLLYVTEGQLSVKIGDEVRLASPDTFVEIAPGNEYAIANFGTEEVESLAVSIPQKNLEPAPIPSYLKPQGNLSPNQIVFLGDEDDIFYQPNRKNLRVYGGEGNDELYATQDNRLFGEEGEDLLDAFSGSGRNLLDGGEGNDFLIAGNKDQLVGGDGDDTLIIVNGGENVLYGNAGADQFWIVNGRIPDTVPDPRQVIDQPFPFPDLRPLEDTRNIIADFEQGIDKIYISGVSGISKFDDLKFLPAFGDLRSTSVLASLDGKDISLANLSGVLFNELSAGDFVFA
ncbi:CHRD domain-containing protein [Komarekiella sp. 'clone 1']|uniref:CHRD domain-containing protein n=1 Tax=Komarekiella delphini-convector SJRDD-AB1 TaxID=2593771 RepID=A0AA40SUK0_9NOST|nr:CHRD domain-containing protein [Komarekiella delphini-convector]MBD6615521.1 CHRD domain-containing protein [Komarekiella delphini-convector SJRDD-AB1]